MVNLKKPSLSAWKLSLMATSVVFAFTAIAQEPGPRSSGLSFLAEPNEIPAQLVNRAEQRAREYLASKGWSEGLNPDGRYVAVGIGTIAANPNQAAYQNQRQNAFEKAMLDAKSKIAQSFSSVIQTSVQQELAAGDREGFDDGNATEEPQMAESGVLDKVRMIFDDELNQELERRGIAPDSAEAEEVARRIPEESSTFRSAVQAISQAEVGALLVSKIYEQDKNIAVVAYYSPTTKELAKAMVGTEPAPTVPPRRGMTLSQWVNQLTVPQLYPTFGVQLHADERGNIAILSFGQSVVESASGISRRIARERANLSSVGAIRQFVGEAVAYERAQEELERVSRFNEEELESINETVSESSISSIAESREISGIQTLRTWTTQDQRSGTFIVGVVNRWDINASDRAITERDEFAEIGGSSPGSSQSSARADSGTQAPGSGRTTTGIGEGESEPVESIPSMDF